MCYFSGDLISDKQKSPKNFPFSKDFDNLELKLKCRFTMTFYYCRYILWQIINS